MGATSKKVLVPLVLVTLPLAIGSSQYALRALGQMWEPAEELGSIRMGKLFLGRPLQRFTFETEIPSDDRVERWTFERSIYRELLGWIEWRRPDSLMSKVELEAYLSDFLSSQMPALSDAALRPVLDKLLQLDRLGLQEIGRLYRHSVDQIRIDDARPEELRRLADRVAKHIGFIP